MPARVERPVERLLQQLVQLADAFAAESEIVVNAPLPRIAAILERRERFALGANRDTTDDRPLIEQRDRKHRSLLAADDDLGQGEIGELVAAHRQTGTVRRQLA